MGRGKAGIRYWSKSRSPKPPQSKAYPIETLEEAKRVMYNFNSINTGGYGIFNKDKELVSIPDDLRRWGELDKEVFLKCFNGVDKAELEDRLIECEMYEQCAWLKEIK